MSLWEKFAGVNSRKNGQGEEETVKRVDDIKINVGSGGLLNRNGKGLDHDYTQIRSEITTELIKHIADVAKVSKTRTQFFTRLDDDGISLRVLAAMGVCTEESIAAYRTLRNRGLNALSSEAEGLQRVDEGYALEIFEGEQSLPFLLDANGNRIDEPVTMDELFDQVVSEKAELLQRINNMEVDGIEASINNKYAELDLQNEKKRQETEVSSLDLSMLTTELSAEESKESLAEDAQKEDWRYVLDNMKNKIAKDDQQIEELTQQYEEAKQNDDEEKVAELELVLVPKVADKLIYVISPIFEVEEIEGYKIIFIAQPNDFSYFTTSRDNLLLLTNNIPRYLVNLFLDWIKGVEDQGKRYRVARLEGESLKHKLIECDVALTKESLDMYYATHELSNYVGTGLGEFYSIITGLKGMDALETKLLELGNENKTNKK